MKIIWEHGDKVSFQNRLVRKNRYIDGVYCKYWGVHTYYQSRPRTGIFLGTRTTLTTPIGLSDDRGFPTPIQGQHKVVALISENSRTNPIYVELSELTKAE